MAGTVPVVASLDGIYTQDAVSAQTKRWSQLLSTFESTYKHPASFVSRSPGRVNIIGEHIDYSLYPVLPMAITSDAIFAVSCPDDSASASSNTFKIRISNVESEKFPAHEFDIPYDNVDIDSKVHEWTNYFKCGLKGALQLLKKTHGEGFRPKSMNVLMDGSIPAGGGLSSSAAFVSGSALAVMVANGVKDVSKMDLTEIAIVAEREVGVNSGGMDQSASVLSLRGSALYVSFVPELSARPVQFPSTNPELAFLIAQSFVQSDKHVTGPVCYNLRVVECSLAAAYLHALLNETKEPLPADSGPLGISLYGFQKAYFAKRNSSASINEQLPELVEKVKSTFTKEEGYTREEIAKVIGMTVPELEQRFESTFPVRAETFKLRQRALHVFSEALRVSEFIKLLEQPAEELERDASGSTESYNRKLGDIMNETQDSCRDLYECSCPELDELCAIARKAGGYGSRLTGAGWGGCSVHLVPADKVEAVKEAWEKEYYSKKQLTAEQKEGAVVVSRPGSGSAVFLVKDGVWNEMQWDGTKRNGMEWNEMPLGLTDLYDENSSIIVLNFVGSVRLSHFAASIRFQVLQDLSAPMAPADPLKPAAKEPKTLRRFKLFPKLPTEIRLMIWTLLLPPPRVVDIRMRRKSIPTSAGEILDVGRFISSVDHPIILHVCSESRRVARQHYKLSFPKKTNTEWSPAQTYIDFDNDTVWFDNLRYFPTTPSANSPKILPMAEFAKIKKLAMRHEIDRVLLDSTKLFNPKHFPALEDIYVVGHKVYPHEILLVVYGTYTSETLEKVWEKEKKCPTVHLANAGEIS
ncbi:hypothetical protein V499_07537 [Pseudogymnoascus sp. VKM F-103]|nr:hypothetical protein V499_07537 [Pseudogymnoascus sp. VKM F-103]